MSWKSTKRGYGALAIGLHWSMLLLLVFVYATMELKFLTAKGSAERAALANGHYLLGLAVFLLVWLRLAVRLSGTEPAIEPQPPAWQIALARGVQWTLYALMIGLPLIGWLTLSARGTSIALLGAELPALIGKNRDLARLLKEIHESGATAGYLLVGLHAGAALYHHYSMGDNTLTRMLPGRRAGA